jgi:2-oxoglutarate dehydrogenase E2 component (dihydrolipoamide succinyltransferase)
MSIEIKIPSVGESVQEAVLAEWFKKDGDTVRKDEPLFVIETDKVTLEVVAEADGVLTILVQAGETVAIGTVVGSLEPVAAGAAPVEKPKAEAAPEPETASTTAPAPAAANAPAPAAPAPSADGIPLAPSVRRLIAEKRLDASKIQGTGPGGRLSKGDVLLYLENAPAGIPDAPSSPAAPTDLTSVAAMEERKPMTPIRKRIAERLLAANRQHGHAHHLQRNRHEPGHGDSFALQGGLPETPHVSLGFMSFFVKACVAALKEVPEINAFIDGMTSSTTTTSTSAWPWAPSGGWWCR